MRIAMIGQRGIPATWGGVERHVEELSARLVARGHEVTAYGRPGYAGGAVKEVRGVRVQPLRTVHGKGIEALVHSFQSAVHALSQDYDVVHFHAVGPGLAAPLSRVLSRAAVVQTVHGLDADRAKWGGPARAALRLGTWLSARVPHETIVVSKELVDHYATVYGRGVTRITNGVPEAAHGSPRVLKERFGLEPGSYVLHVGRLVPEKAADLLIEAFAQSGDHGVRLVIAGDSCDTDDYVAQLEKLAREVGTVDLVGYAGGADLAALYAHARAYVTAATLEGLPLTLLEAVSYRLPLVVSAIAPHTEVVGDVESAGVHLATPGSVREFAGALERAMEADPVSERLSAGERADRLIPHYNWDAVAERTETVYRRALDARGGSAARAHSALRSASC